jgi:L-arabinose isomerase
VKAIDYAKINSLGDRGRMTGEWLAHCQACSVPEIACVFNRAGIDYHLVTGYLYQFSKKIHCSRR